MCLRVSWCRKKGQKQRNQGRCFRSLPKPPGANEAHFVSLQSRLEVAGTTHPASPGRHRTTWGSCCPNLEVPEKYPCPWSLSTDPL